MTERYVEVFEDYWVEHVCDEAGNLDKDKVMRELSDYYRLMENATEVYNAFTPFSKPHTDPVHVIKHINGLLGRGDDGRPLQSGCDDAGV